MAVRVTMSPRAPHVGDTVEFVVETRIPDPGPRPEMREDLLMPRFLVSRMLSCGNGEMISTALVPQVVVLYPAR